MKKTTGVFIMLIGFLLTIIFESSSYEFMSYIGGIIFLLGIGIIFKNIPKTDEGFIPPSFFRTEKDLKHSHYYKRIHSSKSHKDNPNYQYRAVLEDQFGVQRVFFLSFNPPKNFFWIDGKCAIPKTNKTPRLLSLVS